MLESLDSIEFYKVPFAQFAKRPRDVEPLLRVLDVIFTYHNGKPKPLVCQYGLSLFEDRIRCAVEHGEPIKRPTAFEIDTDAEEQQLRALIQSVKVAEHN